MSEYRFKIGDFVQYTDLSNLQYGTVIDIAKGAITRKTIYTIKKLNNSNDLVWDDYVIAKINKNMKAFL